MKCPEFWSQTGWLTVCLGFLRLLLDAALAVGQPVMAPDSLLPFAPRTYVCYRSDHPLRIDGRLDEPAWQAAPWSEPFVDIEGPHRPPPPYHTRIKLLWDDTYLYIGAELEEPHLWATLTRRDTIIFYDNDFEVFIDPDSDTHTYYELEINALGTVWDLLLLKPYRDGGPALNAWDIRDLKAAVALDGTLNDPSDIDRGWTVELALPWTVLAEAAPEGRPPRPGEQWRMNFSRVQWPLEVIEGRYRKRRDPATGRLLPESNWVWSPQGVINMHLPERWGYVQFSAIVAGEGTEPFQPAPEEPLRWQLRQLYYRQRLFREQHGRYARTFDELNVPANWRRRYHLTLQTTESLYEITARLPDGTRLHIREDGRIWKTFPDNP
ncbi:carbohydrate-binding family 9-like protein [Rhodothermus profundi]|uniref:Carbohydrate family 9 binding domain-like n=1 Tax=Rhodothermus profundi TaxID=633813 RepID=A0A1M6R871_9BACT|nr:carbohydrate-binding family 9-like protein [Rhodothermus profundi]SHK28669.1 Carbohydrate family 9 binding domain-like [Rhodothermus profundi]